MNITDAVSRFLGWPLPKTFAPDCGISFDGRNDDEFNKNKTWPVGTNLFTATEAKAMFEHCLGDRASTVAKDGCKLCLGAKGGVPGNENVIGGIVVCDYCTAALMDMKAAGWFATPKPEASAATQQGPGELPTKNLVHQVLDEMEALSADELRADLDRHNNGAIAIAKDGGEVASAGPAPGVMLNRFIDSQPLPVFAPKPEASAATVAKELPPRWQSVALGGDRKAVCSDGYSLKLACEEIEKLRACISSIRPAAQEPVGYALRHKETGVFGSWLYPSEDRAMLAKQQDSNYSGPYPLVVESATPKPEASAATQQAGEAECRKTCNICGDENGNPWPCAKMRVKATLAAPISEDTGKPTAADAGGLLGVQQIIDAAWKHGTQNMLHPLGKDDFQFTPQQLVDFARALARPTAVMAAARTPASVGSIGDAPEFRALAARHRRALDAADYDEARLAWIALVAYIDTLIKEPK